MPDCDRSATWFFWKVSPDVEDVYLLGEIPGVSSLTAHQAKDGDYYMIWGAVHFHRRIRHGILTKIAPRLCWQEGPHRPTVNWPEKYSHVGPIKLGSKKFRSTSVRTYMQMYPSEGKAYVDKVQGLLQRMDPSPVLPYLCDRDTVGWPEKEEMPPFPH